LDPLVLDRWVDKYRKGKRKLSDLTQHYGVAVDDELHNADVDVIATLDVLEEMARRWPQIGATALDRLRAVQANAHYEWATSLGEYFRRKGLDRAAPETRWL
jgi:DNA polymerase-3 subunit epsilon